MYEEEEEEEGRKRLKENFQKYPMSELVSALILFVYVFLLITYLI